MFDGRISRVALRIRADIIKTRHGVRTSTHSMLSQPLLHLASASMTNTPTDYCNLLAAA
jgi:hypothetical protein